jgi:molybdate-binding protein
MVNRQRGSGTRSMIDQLLAANGLRPESIAGYAHEEFTHEAIAATIAAGQADVGLGIEAAAARYDLGFVPVVWERYGFRHARGDGRQPGRRSSSWRACTATPSASDCWPCQAMSRCRCARRARGASS